MKSTSMSRNLGDIVLLKELTDIGVALSLEKNHEHLLEMIMMKAKELTNADGATLYDCMSDDQYLHFNIMLTESLGIHLGGNSDNKITVNPLPLYDKTGNPNTSMVATWAATSKQTVNIKDAYHEKKFDFSGTFKLDKQLGYHSKSFLTVPMTNHLNEVIGVLQLINARDKNNKVVSFSKKDQQIVESLASQAAVCLTNHMLIEAQKKLFDALIQLIASSIDKKSPYTAGHCRRVPIITRMLADAACRITKGAFKNFNMTEDEIYELEVAAWLHDCGKIITPEYVIDKATKLETIFDRVHLIDTRFEILKRDAIITSLQKQLKVANGDGSYDLSADTVLQQELRQLNSERDYIRICNIGKETMSDENIANIMQIAKRTWVTPSGLEEPFLSEDEIQNLQIYRGTLTVRERDIINDHVKVTTQMLESLPYPKKLKRVPEFAGCHHEKMDGTGYPKGLTKEQLPIQARMIAIADVFEALTASDRPYKKAMPLSQCLTILGKMKQDGHIDPDLFDVFIHEKIYLKYAQQYLDKHYIDDIDVRLIPGYKAIY